MKAPPTVEFKADKQINFSGWGFGGGTASAFRSGGMARRNRLPALKRPAWCSPRRQLSLQILEIKGDMK